MEPENNDLQNRRRGTGDRIAEHSRGLLEDVRDYLELRVAGFNLEVRESRRIQRRVYARYAATGILAALAAGSLLTAASLHLGAVLGDAALGFLVTGAAAALAAGLLYGTRPSGRTGNHRKNGGKAA